MRPAILSMVLALLFSGSWSLRAQHSSQCSSDSANVHEHTIKYLYLSFVDSGTRSFEDELNSPPLPATAAHRVLTVRAVCARLRAAMRTLDRKQRLGFTFEKARWSFFELGSCYGVLITWPLPPDLIVNDQKFPIYLFDKGTPPRLVEAAYMGLGSTFPCKTDRRRGESRLMGHFHYI